MSNCKHEFLKPGHSEKYGELNISNWKKVFDKGVQKRIDPEILNLLLILNERGFKTYFACCGGHKGDGRKSGSHIEGYIALSPPSRAVFKLYFALQRTDRRFDFRARFCVENEDHSSEQMVCSEFGVVAPGPLLFEASVLSRALQRYVEEHIIMEASKE